MSSEKMEDQRVTRGPIFVRSVLADFYKRAAGLLLVTIAVVLAIEWFPRAPEGHAEPIPLVLMGALFVATSLAGMRCLKPSSLTGKWTLRFGLGFGVLFCLVGLAGV